MFGVYVLEYILVIVELLRSMFGVNGRFIPPPTAPAEVRFALSKFSTASINVL